MVRTRQHIIPLIPPLIILGVLLLASTNNCERFEPEAKLKVRTDSITSISADAFSIDGNIVYVAKDIEGFAECIKLAIKEDNEGLRKRRIEVAKENSWQTRIGQMSSLIEAEAERKKADREARWKEN